MEPTAFDPSNELSSEDWVDLRTGRARVRDLLLDGAWHSADKIRRTAGGSEGLRRLRELRQDYLIEKRRISGSRHYEYRMILL
jgi:hypothetical protein|tara:strand:- start:914 stop:1162 length:249 start_codon:yes stop_codon:yes gene_type:complete